MKDWKDILYDKYKNDELTGIFKIESQAAITAQELVDRFTDKNIFENYPEDAIDIARTSALICVDVVREFARKHAHKDLADLQELDEIEHEIKRST